VPANRDVQKQMSAGVVLVGSLKQQKPELDPAVHDYERAVHD